MVTDRPDIALGIVTADCAPILFADLRAGVIAAAHAGWRGAVAGVIEATVAAMTRLGANPATTAAAIGPCIRQGSYEVGADLRDAVLAHEPRHGRFFAPGRREGHWQFDLPGYCAARLAAACIGFDRNSSMPTPPPTKRGFSATGAARLPAAARSATRFPSSHWSQV